jgi:hypothetical protein
VTGHVKPRDGAARKEELETDHGDQALMAAISTLV